MWALAAVNSIRFLDDDGIAVLGLYFDDHILVALAPDACSGTHKSIPSYLMHSRCYRILTMIACGHATGDTRLGSCI